MKRFIVIALLLAMTVAASVSCTASRGGRSAGCYSNKGMVGYH